jgi:excisionase family DNA binding protein
MKSLIRIPKACARLSVGKSKFYEFVNEGRIRLVHPGPKISAVVEDELDALIAEFIAERDETA